MEVKIGKQKFNISEDGHIMPIAEITGYDACVLKTGNVKKVYVAALFDEVRFYDGKGECIYRCSHSDYFGERIVSATTVSHGRLYRLVGISGNVWLINHDGTVAVKHPAHIICDINGHVIKSYSGLLISDILFVDNEVQFFDQKGAAIYTCSFEKYFAEPISSITYEDGYNAVTTESGMMYVIDSNGRLTEQKLHITTENAYSVLSRAAGNNAIRDINGKLICYSSDAIVRVEVFPSTDTVRFINTKDKVEHRCSVAKYFGYDLQVAKRAFENDWKIKSNGKTYIVDKYSGEVTELHEIEHRKLYDINGKEISCYCGLPIKHVVVKPELDRVQYFDIKNQTIYTCNIDIYFGSEVDAKKYADKGYWLLKTADDRRYTVDIHTNKLSYWNELYLDGTEYAPGQWKRVETSECILGKYLSSPVKGPIFFKDTVVYVDGTGGKHSFTYDQYLGKPVNTVINGLVFMQSGAVWAITDDKLIHVDEMSYPHDELDVAMEEYPAPTPIGKPKFTEDGVIYTDGIGRSFTVPYAAYLGSAYAVTNHGPMRVLKSGYTGKSYKIKNGKLIQLGVPPKCGICGEPLTKLTGKGWYCNDCNYLYK